jgi:hypothetical protein
MAGRETENREESTTKVGRLLERYDLVGLGDELERRWTAPEGERLSLRDLEALFNRRLLERTMRDAGMASIEGEVGNLYQSLTSDEVSSGVRTEARNRLERAGVDVEQLERDFVSYQAIRTYLKEARGADHTQRTDAEQIAKDRDTIQRLRARTSSVAEDKLERLKRTERIDLGEFRLFTEMNVLCEDCGNQYSVEDLLDRGGCDCTE